MADETRPRRFHERFELELGTAEVKRRFVSRCFNHIFNEVRDRFKHRTSYGLDLSTMYRRLSFEFGIDSWSTGSGFDQFFQLDSSEQGFTRCLEIVEVVYEVVAEQDTSQTVGTAELSHRITEVVQASEIDLGIDWQPPIFVRTGARLLDEELVNEPLRWLAEPKYESVRKPFEKGLSHYLEAQNKPDRLADVITDMYEAVEALAKIVTGRSGKDLSGNVERFISDIGVSRHYKTLLRNYISYGNEFRHAEKEGKPRPPLSEAEVESFIYLSGLFIRLAIQTT